MCLEKRQYQFLTTSVKTAHFILIIASFINIAEQNSNSLKYIYIYVPIDIIINKSIFMTLLCYISVISHEQLVIYCTDFFLDIIQQYILVYAAIHPSLCSNTS